MDDNKSALLATSDEDKPVSSRTNWIVCSALLFSMTSSSVWLLTTNSSIAWVSAAKVGSIYFVIFHGAVAVTATLVLIDQYRDPIPMVARYRVPGNPSIALVEHSFVHFGRWTTFTTWCNTLSACYFWIATVASILAYRDKSKELSWILVWVLGVLWDITFPMGYLVNLIVTFVLIPTKKKQQDFVGVWYMLKLRGQLLHNGYVIFVALEAILLSPTMSIASFPVIVLYGMAYILFSYCLFAKVGLFHYFFLDPRWKYAPLGIIGLGALCASLFCAGTFAVQAAHHSWLVKALIAIATLATCTFRDSSAIPPETGSGSAVA